MISRPTSEKLRCILVQAARLIHEKGYEGTSMQDIADACEMTKAGLYHHIAAKEALLLAIMHYGMDLFEERVIAHVEHIADPLERLKATLARNVELVTQDSTKEVAIILHEHSTLTGESKREINTRKKAYVDFLERTLEEAMARGQIRKVDPTLAAFSFLGTVNWTYKWFRSDGALTPQQLADGIGDLYFRGLLP